MNRTIFLLFAVLTAALSTATAQERRVQNKPYVDLRPLHFGILVGTHVQDVDLQNVGPQLVTDAGGNTQERVITADADRWNPGFHVGVMADWRLHDHVSLRFSPTLYFGSKHLTLLDLTDTDADGTARRYTQDLKNTYLALPVSMKFSAQRWNNYRPYVVAGISPTVNLTGRSEDYVQLRRFNTMVELGMGCDFYLPFFKLIPELKFCYGLGNALDLGHKDRLTDANKRPLAASVSSAHTKMVVLTFYFE